jgi:hypothetical protein
MTKIWLLIDRIVERWEKYAAEVGADHAYDEDDEDWGADPPWPRAQMTDEARRWLHGRKEAGMQIDIETCELGHWAADDLDPYGILRQLGKELPEELQQVGMNRFVRSSESDGWVWEGDLPEAKAKALYDRIERERQTRMAAQIRNTTEPESPRDVFHANGTTLI